MSDTEIPKGHGAWHGGKGSVAKDSDQKKYADNYDAIFGKKDKKEVDVEPVKNDGPVLPNGLARAWARKK
tara:strand:+ start:210 stop:419 length:210 start_codon:yes stop_codon:yes gene_type:complete